MHIYICTYIYVYAVCYSVLQCVAVGGRDSLDEYQMHISVCTILSNTNIMMMIAFIITLGEIM